MFPPSSRHVLISTSSRSRNYAASWRRLFSQTSSVSGNGDSVGKVKVNWLNLRGSGLSILERLLLEECLLRCDPEKRNWLIAGTHDAGRHRFLRNDLPPPDYISEAINNQRDNNKTSDGGVNTSSAIVLGLGGKPELLLNVPLVKQEGCLCIKRFTGGGTVVLDPDCIWTTLIFRPAESSSLPESFPRPIMEWSAEKIFGPLFASLGKIQQDRTHAVNESQKREPRSTMVERKGGKSLVLDTKSCGAENSGKTVNLQNKRSNNSSPTTELPQFALRENDYVLGGDLKMGGNAQAITKNGWLHHTSFLWDYQSENMNLLTLPPKRPEYRLNRTHSDFLTKLGQVYPNLDKRDFMLQLPQTLMDQPETFQVETMTLSQAMQVVEDQGGMQNWLEKQSRTRVLQELP